MLAFVALPTRAQVQAAAKATAELKVGQLLTDAAMLGLNGPTRHLSDFRGKALIINVWASWCGPCRQEMASLERLAWQETSESFVVIGISTDDSAALARQLLRQTNATISHFIDSKLQLETMLGASRLPLTVLVNANGQIVDKVYGAQQWDGPEARARIGRAFGRQSSASR